MFALALLLAQPVLTVREPTPPDRWEQKFEVACGEETLRISGYGHRRPGQAPSLATRRGALIGPSAQALQEALANPAAAYRLGARCLPDRGGIWFVAVRGERVNESVNEGARPRSRMEYRTFGATIRDGEIVEYRRLEDSNEETFWFR